MAQPVVEEDRGDVAVDDGPGVDAGGETGDLAPGWRPDTVRPAPGHRGPGDHEAGSTAELGQVPSSEGFLIVEVEVGRQTGHSALDCLTPGRDLETDISQLLLDAEASIAT